MSILTTKLNDVLSDWRTQFDLLNAVELKFSNHKGALHLNDLPLFPETDSLELLSANFDAEHISFQFDKNRSLSLDFIWPEDQPPRISSVSFEYDFGSGIERLPS